MGNCRFLYDNLITDETMITVSSLRTGLVTSAIKNGTGSATITTSGDFSGATDLEYRVKIDSVAGGAEVGQATFKWSDGGGEWDATGVATDTSPVTLNNGVKVAFTAGSGADFVIDDEWRFKAINKFNSGKTIDWDRDSRYRSASLESPNTITIDLGSAQEVTALVLYDHNLTSAATISIKGNSADDWGAPAFSEAVTHNTGKIIHYLSSAQTYRYFQIQITDAANPDAYIEIGELFLGPYTELSENYSYGAGKRPISTILSSVKNAYGKKRNRYYGRQLSFDYGFKLISGTDIELLETMLEALGDKDAGTIQPIYFNENSTYPNNTWMVEFTELPWAQPMNDYYTTTMNMLEVMRSV